MLPQGKKSHLSDELSFWEIARGGEEGLASGGWRSPVSWKIKTVICGPGSRDLA